MSFQVQALAQLLKAAKRRYLFKLTISAFPWILLTSSLAYFLSHSVFAGIIVFIFLVFIVLGLGFNRDAYKKITCVNLLRHLNREFEQLEESAELVLASPKQLNLLEQLQQIKVCAILDNILKNEEQRLLPKYSYKANIWVSFFVSATLVLVWQSHIQQWVDWSQVNQTNETEVLSEIGAQLENNVKPFIQNTQILIEPPQYTSESHVEQSELNITLLSGAKVTWSFTFSQPDSDYQLQFSDGKALNLEHKSKNQYRVQAFIEQTGLYFITSSRGRLEGVYSITAMPDRRPIIRVVTPKKTITEVTRDRGTIIELEAVINDDFEITNADILASIAKGSGEAVKFRDEEFSFDSTELIEGKTTYLKTWRLTELGMEPGDELYFTIRAWDNKTPERQQTKSQTKIIRWLEEDEDVVLSSGILIDFIPEYFKSQRQIIIETQELITNKAQLDLADFMRTSQQLGQAQSDLKQKYGQFLGDEFGEGGADVGGTPHEADHDEDEDHHDDHHASDEEQTAESDEGHEHEHEERQEAVDDISGYSSVIEQYGHAHGEVDIGIITEQNPKAMMKRAISAMWQAELHLLLSEPENALPFENEALHFLNKAKKAERIYVKRLGFEPPPVTEERRYQGDLTDIDDRQRLINNEENANSHDKISSLLSLIEVRRDSLDTRLFNADERSLLTDVKTRLLQHINSEPNLITAVTTLENAVQVRTFKADFCDDCIEDLEKTLWRFIPSNNVELSVTADNLGQTEVGRSYLEVINKEKSRLRNPQ